MDNPYVAPSKENTLSRRNVNVGALVATCFLTPAVWINLWLAYMLLVYRLIGFTPVRITYWSLLGCLPQTWMQPVTFFANQGLFLAFVATGFWLSKKAVSIGSFRWTLAGAALVYPIVERIRSIAETIIFQRNMLWFTDREAYFEQKNLAVFGNLYNFKWASFCIDWAITLLVSVLAYLIIFKYWPPVFRKYVFTVGALSAGLGWIVWYFWLGPILY